MILNFVRPGLKARTLFFGTVMYVYFIMTKTKFAKNLMFVKYIANHTSKFIPIFVIQLILLIWAITGILFTPFHILKAVFQ